MDSTVEAARPEAPRTPGSRIAALVGGVLLWCAAVAGSICILSVIAALTLHLSLIMFKTGSMAPAIPTGSLALVREIPADQIRIGEVVTVDRPGQLPITHRVVKVSGTGQDRVIVLKGDANPTVDPAPYRVRTVRLVVFSVPRLAYAVVWLSDPPVVGGVTIGVASLVMWAFWPRDGARRRRHRTAR